MNLFISYPGVDTIKFTLRCRHLNIVSEQKESERAEEDSGNNPRDLDTVLRPATPATTSDANEELLFLDEAVQDSNSDDVPSVGFLSFLQCQ